METLSSEDKIMEISRQLYESMASTADYIDKRSLLILICDTIDQDNNIGSDQADFDTFVDKYLSGDGLAKRANDADQIMSEDRSALPLKEISSFVTLFMTDRVEKLKNEKQDKDAIEQQALLFSDLISQKSKQYPHYAQSVMDYNDDY